MKRMRVYAVMVVVLAGFVSCSNDEMKRDKSEVQSRLNSAIADVNRETDRIRQEAATASDTTKERLNRQLDELDKARQDLNDELNAIGNTTADAWNDFRRKVDHSIDNAKTAVNDVKRDMSR